MKTKEEVAAEVRKLLVDLFDMQNATNEDLEKELEEEGLIWPLAHLQNEMSFTATEEEEEEICNFFAAKQRLKGIIEFVQYKLCGSQEKPFKGPPRPLTEEEKKIINKTIDGIVLRIRQEAEAMDLHPKYSDIAVKQRRIVASMIDEKRNEIIFATFGVDLEQE